MRSAHIPGSVERIVKYIANSPAKNMISLESQTIVPTPVMFGLVAGPCAVAWKRSASVIVVTEVVATRTLWPMESPEARPSPTRRATRSSGASATGIPSCA
ncbi:hypothetical protein GCM10023341_12980 [Ornithinimicrobium tianjinense]